MKRHAFLFAAFLLALLTSAGAETPEKIRLATYNIRELSTTILTSVNDKGEGRDPQVLSAAKIIKTVRPDILVINEIDHDYTREADGLDLNAKRFRDHYLKVGPDAIDYPYIYVAPCNTGIISGVDLDNNGRTATADDVGGRDYGNDCFGFGNYPGQYSMALYSRFPIDTEHTRTMQKFLWKDLPGNHIPPGYYNEKGLEVFRLSSKSHWDVPVKIGDRTFHLLLSHPTPQGFDADEDRNGRRNFDEVKLWVEYIDNNPAIVDDAGKKGGLAADTDFVIMGDLNTSPRNGSQYDGKLSITQLLKHPRIQDTGRFLTSEGPLRGRAPGAPDFIEENTFGGVSGTRIDYILTSWSIAVLEGGVYWPDPEKDLDGCILAEYASDHRLVWLDVKP